MVLLVKEETHSSNLHLLYEKRKKHFFYYVVERDVDILAVTETWLKADECCDNITSDVTPTGYTFVHSPGLNGISGGVGMLYRTIPKVQQLNSDFYKSFEFKELFLQSDNCFTRIIVYRPPISVKNGLTHAALFYEFSMLLKRLVSSPGNLLSNGDFSFHVNDPSDSTTSQFLDFYKSFEFTELFLQSDNCFTRIIVYRPPISVKNGLTHAALFYEFSMLLIRLVSSPGDLLSNGDFNFHVNDPSDSTTSQFLDLYKSFEFTELFLQSDNCFTRIIVYRPPISVKNGLTHAALFYEFSMLLIRLVSSPGDLLSNGDFNFHVNDPSDSTTSQFLDLLNCFTLDIFNLCTPTHKNNNVLDLIITRSFETFVSNLSVHDRVLSDHFAVHCSLAIKKPPNAKFTVMTRKLCNIDSDSLHLCPEMHAMAKMAKLAKNRQPLAI